MSDDYEDILSDSLEFLGGKRVIDDDLIKYGPLQLTVAPKEGKAISLLADHLFSPSIYLAERIERGLLSCGGKTVIELGAGAALPSLLLSTLPDAPKLAVITDYPDETIYGNLKASIARNRDAFNPECAVICQGYDWGTDPTPLLSHLPADNNSGYEVMILSDLLHFETCHDLLVASILKLLKRSPDAVVHVPAGKYTKPHVCDNFVKQSRKAGLIMEEVHTDPSEPWMGKYAVGGLTTEDLALRKGNCRYWIGRWA